MKSARYTLLYYAVCTLCVFAMFMIFISRTALTSNPVRDCVVYGSESLLLMSPVMLCGPRWRRMAWIMVMLTALFLFANDMYYRFWHSLLPPQTVFSANSYNGIVLKSALGLLGCADLLYGVIAVIPLAAWFIPAIRRAPRPAVSVGLTTIGSALLLYIGAQYMLTRASIRYWSETGITDLTVTREFIRSIETTPSWKARGPIIYSIWFATHMWGSSQHTLSDDERSLIQDFLLQNRSTAPTDSTFAANRSKNLIFIIVESLNAELVGREVAGRSITPTLDSLINAEGTISCLNVLPQIKNGGSSDGQLIYNTGMLPLIDGIASLECYDRTYHTLASVFDRHPAVEIIPESGSVWNHRMTSAAYHYDRLYEDRDAEEAGIFHAATGYDAALFSMACRILPTLPQPFFAELITMSMHYQFNDAGVDSVIDFNSTTEFCELEQNLMSMTYYFDQQLKIFIDNLRKLDMFDNSVIIIASDNNITFDDIFSDDTISPIVFMALNTGRTERVERTVGQVDVFPTVVEIMGIDAPGVWRGVGMSILDPANRSAVDRNGDMHGTSGDSIDSRKRSAREVSDLMIRANYFENL